MSMSEIECSECGCTGNESCGAEIVDLKMNCTLDSFMCCPCCNNLGKDGNMKRWPENKPDTSCEQLTMDI